MDVPEFPSNNYDKSQKDEKNTKKVIQGEAIRRKKTRTSIFGEVFASAFSSVVSDVLLPAAKDMIADTITQTVDRVLFGESRTRHRSSTPQSGRNGYVSYNNYSQRKKPQEDVRKVSKRVRSRHDFDEIILGSRAEAEEVLDRLYDIVGQFDSASVSDLFDLVGVESQYTDDDWGWTDLSGATVRRVRSGYLLDLPRPEFLD